MEKNLKKNNSMKHKTTSHSNIAKPYTACT